MRVTKALYSLKRFWEGERGQKHEEGVIPRVSAVGELGLVLHRAVSCGGLKGEGWQLLTTERR